MKCSNFKQRIRKGIAVFMAGVAACSLFFPFDSGMSSVKAASPLESGELWLGDTKVTPENCADILGDGTASYAPDTMTLTLNGVHIGPDNAYIADKNGNVCDLTQIQTASGVFACSLYAKNTVSNLVINGYNTFEVPQVSRQLKAISPPDEYKWQIARQFEVYYGIVIDNKGNAGTNTITGTGTLKSTVPEMDLEVPAFPDDHRHSLGALSSMQGGTALAWRTAQRSNLYIGEEGKTEGPTLELTSSMVALNLWQSTIMYSGKIDGVVTRWDGYNSKGAPYNCVIVANGSTGSRNHMLELEGESYMHTKVPIPDGVSSRDVRVSLTYKGTIDGSVKSEWYREDGYANGGPEGHYGTRELGEKLERQELGLDPTEESYEDVTIDVQGFTEDMTVYSVDMEWGAMTFQYENTIWDATEHKSVAGAGWKVYDSVADKALDTTQDAVNQIKVTNHSNADVYATLDYAAEKTDDKDYSDTTGNFAKNAEDTDTQFRQKSPYAPAYLTLGNADNGNGPAEGVGMPTTGTVFFMPLGIKEEYKPKDQIAKWSQIGTITVGIKTEKPGP